MAERRAVVGPRKLAGILAEAAVQARHAPAHRARLRRQPAIRPRIRPSSPRARLRSSRNDRPAERGLLLAEIVAALADRCADLQAGRFDAILSAWRRLAARCPWRASRMGLARLASSADVRKTSIGTVLCWCASARS